MFFSLSLLIALSIATAVVVALDRLLDPAPRAIVLGVLAMSALATARIDAQAARARAAPLVPDDRGANDDDSFASASRCASCHVDEAASWARTYHRTMTQPARADTVRAPFDGRTLSFQGRTYRVFTAGERFVIEMPAFGTDGRAPADRWTLPVEMVTGSHTLQAYWVRPPRAAPDVESYRAYRARCDRCHGPDGAAPWITGENFLDDELEAAFTDAHRRLDPPSPAAGRPPVMTWPRPAAGPVPVVVSADELQRALDYLGRAQFDGEVAQFPFVYLIQEDRWLHEEHSFLQPAPDFEEVERPGDRWSRACDGCHATGAESAVDVVTTAVERSVVDLGIACESCHGAGRAHAAAHASPLARWDAIVADGDALDIVNPRALSAARATDLCARCHAETVERRDASSADFVPGGDLSAVTHLISLADAGAPFMKRALDDDPGRLTGSFWPDGTARVAGRSASGMNASACVQSGQLSCLSCHQMHGADPDDQLKPGAREGETCLGCHADVGARAVAHSRHPAGTVGCLDCHLPYTTFGLLKAIRSHRIDSPQVPPPSSKARPNACNLCHLDETTAWAARALASWNDDDVAAPERPPAHDTMSPAGLRWLLAGDGAQRAVAAWHLGDSIDRGLPAPAWADPALLLAARDPFPAVRFLALQALGARHGDVVDGVRFDDPASVRTAALRELLAALRARGVAAPDPRMRALVARRDLTPLRINE